MRIADQDEWRRSDVDARTDQSPLHGEAPEQSRRTGHGCSLPASSTITSASWPTAASWVGPSPTPGSTTTSSVRRCGPSGSINASVGGSSGTTSFMFGYNTQNWSQENGIGAELVPGAINRLLYAQPTYSQHGLTFNQFSPVGELRLEAAYYLTQAFALKVGYTGMYVGNIKRAVDLGSLLPAGHGLPQLRQSGPDLQRRRRRHRVRLLTTRFDTPNRSSLVDSAAKRRQKPCRRDDSPTSGRIARQSV